MPPTAPLSRDMPIDITQLQHLIEAGGPVIGLLMLMSLLAMTVFLVKCWQFFWMKMGRHRIVMDALQLWHAKNPDLALTRLSTTRHPIARVLETAMTLKSRPNVEDSLIREEVMRKAKRELASARSHLRILELIATLSPLLGLLGTVLGMIDAFQKLQGAGSRVDPALLSGGIWEALLTTAAGLIVAIPTVMALHWLEQRVDAFRLTMEDALTQVFTGSLMENTQQVTRVSRAKQARLSEEKSNFHIALANSG
ncbi:MAG: MotA/TolQ/ExbB proton channel family protein [Cellvibrionaceae bacterium]|nr:MotA/TolQ/ExbB proton channel family protein [Cellvibrionaceae bacterium]